ncbi:hypothetical protein Golob_003343 [Gossypium lobatum]|uniref:Phospholipase A1 n=1 Tax=Gossypium lobatum TaxID=34289 RepID=A0A7J8MYA5_9ROSI|nr:hypothetical protein [Gossypium lobatum]
MAVATNKGKVTLGRKNILELVYKYQNEEVSITITGHSLAAALATLNAMDIANNVLKGIFDRLKNLHLLRIVNFIDPILKVPFAPGIYFHMGQELGIDITKSPYLKWNINPHNLKAYQYGIAGC